MSPTLSGEGRPVRRSGMRLPLRRKYNLTLVGRRRVAQRMLRVTLSGFDLESFRYRGGDHRCTLLIPWAEDQAWRYMVPAYTDPWTAASQWGFIAALSRPLPRQVTVSGYRADELEIDFDILLRGEGALGDWARRAPLGTTIGVLDNGRRYHVSSETRWQVLIADETGAPAALAIAAETPATVPTTLYVPGAGVATAAHMAGDHVTVIPVPSHAEHRASGELFAAVVLAHGLPIVPDKVGIAGERTFTQTLVALLHRAGVARSAIHAGNYWKLQ